MDEYVLRGGDQAEERLTLLARVKWPSTHSLLRRVGVRRGWRCLDVGCGIGRVTLKLARWVGMHGRAVGTDTDERCLELARSEAARRRLPVVFRQEGATGLAEEAAYDLVFARFLLTHLPQPAQALVRMRQAACPSGLVVVEDIDFAGHFCYPACPAFERYVALYQEAVRQKGGDANIGPRLLGLFLDAAVEDVQLRVVQPAYREGPGKRLAAVTLEHIRESVVKVGLATAAEVDGLLRELNVFAADSRTILSLPRIFQLWGRRGR